MTVSWRTKSIGWRKYFTACENDNQVYASRLIQENKAEPVQCAICQEPYDGEVYGVHLSVLSSFLYWI